MTPLDSQVSARARELVVALPKLFRVRALHDWSNRALAAPIAELVDAGRRLVDATGPITFQVVDHSVFLDRELLRFDASTFDAARNFSRILARHRLAGLSLEAAPTESEWKLLLDLLVEPDAGGALDVNGIGGRLVKSGVRSLRVFAARTLPHLDVPARAVDERAYVILTYARAVTVLREYVRRIDRPERALYAVRAKRVVMDLADVVSTQGQRFLALASIKRRDEYLFGHSVNAVLLSLLLGQRIGLERGELADLGMAALFHDLGKALLPAELRSERRRYSEADRRRMQLHPLHAVQHFMEASRFSGDFFSRVLVAFECNVEANGYPSAELSRPSHLYSRIVAIACNFDALTTPRPYRPSYLPDEALRLLWDGRGTRFDPILLKLFVERIGLFPIGSPVQLSSGEVAVVVQNHHDSTRAAYPRVRILADSRGRRSGSSETIDLVNDPQRRRVRAPLDPSSVNGAYE